MAETRKLSERCERIGRELIDSEPALAHIAASAARIAFLESDAERKSRGRTVFGCCEKVPEKFKWAVHYDFAVTVFAPNVAGFTDEQLRALVFHELLHVGITSTKDFEERYSVVPHDLEDFRCIVDRFGRDWAHPACAETAGGAAAG